MTDRPVVIVTGGAGHIGRGLCHLFAADGWAVVVADLDADKAVQVAAEIAVDAPEVLGVGVDVTDEASAGDMAQAVVDKFGRIDALINNAGLYGNPAWTGPMLEVAEAQWHAVMSVNVWAQSRACVRSRLS